LLTTGEAADWKAGSFTTADFAHFLGYAFGEFFNESMPKNFPPFPVQNQKDLSS
jgi:hypothetical protein